MPLGITLVDEARIRDGKSPLTDEQKAELAPPEEPKPGDDEDETEKAAGSKKKVSRQSRLQFPGVAPVPGQRYLY